MCECFSKIEISILTLKLLGHKRQLRMIDCKNQVKHNDKKTIFDNEYYDIPSDE
jgi:hypothetical protein